jgi:hypothetical protein
MHDMFECTLLLTKNYKTSRSSHDILEKIIKKNCEKIMILDYGLKMSPETVLKIADTEEWLLQSELKAINDGLIYGETDDPFMGYKYRGYLN